MAKRKSKTDGELKDLIKDIMRTHPQAGYEEIVDAVRSLGASFASYRFHKLYESAFQELRGVNDAELVVENIRLAKATQRERDMNRIKNKSFRQHARIDNALVECGERIIEIVKETKWPWAASTKIHPTNGEKYQALVQLSDLHLNELVTTQTNQYDFEVAAKRLRLYAAKVKFYLKAFGIKSVVVVNTGDILNSDRRLDEYLSQSTNRMNAAMLSVHLIGLFLRDLNELANVTYIQVSGNESRVKDEPGYTDMVLTDNYDSLIYNMLKLAFGDTKAVRFLDGDVAERVIRIFDSHVLVTHGEQIGQGTAIADVQKIKGKYAQYGVSVDFVVFGHIHCTHVHDHFARGASLVGANAYTDRGLQLTTRASQNIHLFSSAGARDSIVVDLQNVDGVEGYPIVKELAAYNAKSEKKLHQQTVIHEIVI